MEKKAVSGIMLALLLVGISTLMSNIQPVQTQPPTMVYIRADGSIDPPTAPIQRDGDMYTLTHDIVISPYTTGGIMIERNNMTLNGAGYTIRHAIPIPRGATGIHLTSKSNVTIKNTNIRTFNWGIQYGGRFNNIFGNNITYNMVGISVSGFSNINVVKNNITNNNIGLEFILSSNNTICGNNIEANGLYGIYTSWVSNITIFRNSIKANDNGLYLGGASDSTVTENNIEANGYGISIEVESSRNSIYHNNFIDNTVQATVGAQMDGYTNTWDDDYPSGGNYWSDYMGEDFFSGPGQEWPDSDGIGDTPYLIDAYNQDRYPLMERALATRMAGDINGDGKTDAYDLFLLAKNYGNTEP